MSIVNDVDGIEIGNTVLVMSKKWKFLAHGIVTMAGGVSGKVYQVKVTSFDTYGIDVQSCIDSEVPDNTRLEIGKEYSFAESEIVVICDDGK